ncbi:MAG: diacylglycerol kinase family protein [Polyangiaceae bacterium]
MKIGILLNPNSRKNRRQGEAAADRLSHLKQRVGDLGHVVQTQSTDELRVAIQELVSDGVEYLVSDGGDGALHWALNEVRRLRGDEALIPIVPTCGGTIDFVARKVGVAGTQDEIVERLIQRAERKQAPRVIHLDSLRLSGMNADDSEFDRLGFALAAGGVGQRFFDHYYSSPDPSPATIVAIVLRTVASFALGALHVPRTETLQSYAEQLFRPTLANVELDGERLRTTEQGAIHAGAFDVSLGGVFRVFPLAAEPGQLHFQAGAITPLEIIAALPDLVRGGAIRSANLREIAGTEMKIRALGDELLAPIIDGEQFPGLRSLNVTPGPQVPIAIV